MTMNILITVIGIDYRKFIVRYIQYTKASFIWNISHGELLQLAQLNWQLIRRTESI